MSPVIIFVVDGLRPEALSLAATPVLDALIAAGRCTLAARTVMPSVTLPSHMSLFHSVDPGRHGVVTNTWTPQVRPVPGLFDVARQAGLRAAAFYNWEELRDLWRPGAVEMAYYWHDNKTPGGDIQVAHVAAETLGGAAYDLAFVYLGHTDSAGHRDGWLSPYYLAAVSNADGCIGQVVQALGSAWNVVVLADHGGHERSHGTPSDEDMTIPLIMAGPTVGAGPLEGATIMDVAPTVAKLTGLYAPVEWEGRALL